MQPFSILNKKLEQRVSNGQGLELKLQEKLVSWVVGDPISGENGQMPILKKIKIQHFAPFPKLIKEIPPLLKLDFLKIELLKKKKIRAL